MKLNLKNLNSFKPRKLFHNLIFLLLILVLPGIVHSQHGPTTLCSSLGGVTITDTWGSTGTTTYSSTLSPYSFSSKHIAINGDLVIDHDLTINLSSVKIAAGVKIQIRAGKTLTITRCSLFSCTARWAGIDVLNNYAHLYMFGSIVEDADIAVYGRENAAVNLEANTFNRNRITLSNKKGESYSLRFVSNAVTCNSLLNVPASGQSSFMWAEYGAFFDSTALMTLGVDSASRSNDFSNLNCGLLSYKSRVNVNGCYFHNMRILGSKLVAYNVHGNPVTDTTSQIHGGTGIWGTGLGRVLIKGLTDANTSATIYDNQRNGITIRNSMNLDCQFVRFVYNLGYGISITSNSLSSTVYIYKSSFKITYYKGIGGILIDRSPGSGETDLNIIRYDTFYITKYKFASYIPHDYAHGIVINGQSGATDFMDIDHNILNVYDNRDCHGIYYQFVGGTDFNRITDNIVTPNYYASHGFGIAMIAGDGSGKHNTVYRNLVNGTAFDVGYKNTDLQCGIHHQSCPQVHYCQNEVDGATQGIHCYGTSDQTDLVKNIMGQNYQGFRLDTGALIGGQTCKGNTFYHPLSGYYSYAAAAVDPNVVIMDKFTFNSTNTNEDPNPKVSFSHWFEPLTICQTNLPPTTCVEFDHEGMLVPDVTDFDRLVGNYDYEGEACPSFLFDAQLQLYNRYFDYYDIYSACDTLAHFMDDQSSTIIGGLVQVDRYIRDGLSRPSAIITANDASNAAVNSKLNQLAHLDSLINISTVTVASYWLQRDTLIDTLRTYLADIKDQYDDYIDNRTDLLQDALDLLNSLSPSDVPETNAVDTRRIHLESILYQDGVLNSDQVDTLMAIAIQCPCDGGNAVAYAQALLPDTLTYITCLAEPDTNLYAPKPHLTEVKNTLYSPTIILYPNPSDGLISIISQELIESIYIYTTEGKMVQFVEQVNSNKIQMKIIEKGSYIVQVKDIHGDVSNNKLLIH